MRRLALALAVLAGVGTPSGAEAPPGGPATMHRPDDRAAPPPLRVNAEVARDILDLAFALEDGQALPALGRFEGPVRLRVEAAAPPTLAVDLAALLGRLRTEAGLDVAMAGADEPAEIVIEAVPSEELARAAPGAACLVVPNATSWAAFLRLRGSRALDWATVRERTRAAVFLPADAAPQEIRDCLHEEVAQALGPLNDLARLNDSVFNDDNVHGALTGFDMLALRALNDPAIESGLTRAQVAARLPAILARLNPAGERAGPSAGDPRAGMALLAQGRRQAGEAPDDALASFQGAEAALDRVPGAAGHRAHAQVQLAAFALARGDAAEVLRLTEEARPAAESCGDAALLATLLLLRAEAADGLGDVEGARALRLDGLAWARYGFGAEAAVQARLAEVRALSPWRLALAQGSSR